jgi:hypothetical protein
MGSQISVYYNDYTDIFSNSRILMREPYVILIGVRHKKTQGIHHQCVQINGSRLYSLIRFTRSDKKLIYEFEDDITLIVEKMEGVVFYQFVFPEMGIDIQNKTFYRGIERIGNNSAEIDYLIDYLNS